MQLTDEELQEIVVTAQRKYPGRSWEQLSPEEQKAVFADFKTKRDVGAEMYTTQMPQGKRVGPSGIYVENPWDSVGAGVRKAIGGYIMGQANRQEQTGRGALSDLQTRRDALDAEAARRRAIEEEERRRAMMASIYQ